LKEKFVRPLDTKILFLVKCSHVASATNFDLTFKGDYIMATKLVNKLSVKSAIGKIAVKEIPESGILPLMRLFGVAGKKLSTGNSTYGEWTAFNGQFRAINLRTGEIVESGKLFVPEVAENMLVAALAAEGVESVEFGFDIGVERAETTIGYQYTVTTLQDAKQADPLAALAKQFDAVPLPQLPAPVAAVEDEPVVEVVAEKKPRSKIV